MLNSMPTMSSGSSGGGEMYHYNITLPYNTPKNIQIKNGDITAWDTVGGYYSINYYGYVIDSVSTDVRKSYITTSYDSSTHTLTITLTGPNSAYSSALHVVTDIQQTLT